MLPEPGYAQDIVVGVIFRTAFSWYVTEKEYWFLDYTKYYQAFVASGFNLGKLPPEPYSGRFQIAILNEQTAECFLSSIAERRVPASALSHMMLKRRERDEDDDLLDFAPCLLVNFDQKQLASLYPEMIRFEIYVPDGWTGAYRDFLAEVPEEGRYWNVDGQNLFEKQ